MLKKTKSFGVKIKASAIVTASNSPTGRKSKLPPVHYSLPLPDGDARMKSLLTSPQEQMLLGTMLGDGSMRLPLTLRGNPSYGSRHGWKQHKYNCRKHALLRSFVVAKPKKRKNGGYGKFLSVFTSRNTPVLWPIASLCLRDRLKRVSREWLDKLTWEGVAWWIMDDGARSNRIMVICTHSFTPEEVDLIVRWFKEKGLACKRGMVRSKLRPNYFYPVVRFCVASTYQLADLIRLYVFPEMAYKIDLPPKIETLTCHWCHETFDPTARGQSVYKVSRQRPCCGSPGCKVTRHQTLNDALMAKPGKREEKNAQVRASYAADPEASKKYSREKIARLRAANPEHYLAYKKAWRAKRTAARPPRQLICAGCRAPFTTTVRAKVRYCGLICQKSAADASKQKYASKR